MSAPRWRIVGFKEDGGGGGGFGLGTVCVEESAIVWKMRDTVVLSTLDAQVDFDSIL